MNHLRLILGALALSLAATAGPAADAPAAADNPLKPNIVFFLIDDLGWDPPEGTPDLKLRFQVSDSNYAGAYTTIDWCSGVGYVPYMVAGRGSFRAGNWYKTMAAQSVTACGGRYIVRGGPTELLEGDWQPKRLVILEFPDMAAARAWWSSSEYAEAKALRRNGRTHRVERGLPRCSSRPRNPAPHHVGPGVSAGQAPLCHDQRGSITKLPKATPRSQPGWHVTEFDDSSTTAAGAPAAAALSSAGCRPVTTSTHLPASAAETQENCKRLRSTPMNSSSLRKAAKRRRAWKLPAM